MVTQETLFEFFNNLSHLLREDGYPILDDLRHEFPNIPWYDDIHQEIEENKEIEELVNTEE